MTRLIARSITKPLWPIRWQTFSTVLWMKSALWWLGFNAQSLQCVCTWTFDLDSCFLGEYLPWKYCYSCRQASFSVVLFTFTIFSCHNFYYKKILMVRRSLWFKGVFWSFFPISASVCKGEQELSIVLKWDLLYLCSFSFCHLSKQTFTHYCYCAFTLSAYLSLASLSCRFPFFSWSASLCCSFVLFKAPFSTSPEKKLFLPSLLYVNGTVPHYSNLWKYLYFGLLGFHVADQQKLVYSFEEKLVLVSIFYF